MMGNTHSDLVGETDTVFSLNEICKRCDIHAELVVEMVEYGIVTPLEPTEKRWQFSAEALSRMHRARRLQHDLELNLPGLALTLDLLDEIERLRAEVTHLKHRLGKLHD